MVQDPYYDSEMYRKDGGDGTGHWVYDKVYIYIYSHDHYFEQAAHENIC